MELSALKGSQVDKNRIAQLYRDFGLKIEVSRLGEEVGMYQFWQLLASNKIKVFASLSQFLAEYRVGDEQSPMLLCCHSLLLSRDCMRTKPVETPEFPSRASYGELSWMAY